MEEKIKKGCWKYKKRTVVLTKYMSDIILRVDFVSIYRCKEEAKLKNNILKLNKSWWCS